MKIITEDQRRAMAVMPLTGRAPHANRGTPPRPHWPMRSHFKKMARQLAKVGYALNKQGFMVNGQPFRQELLHPRSKYAA